MDQLVSDTHPPLYYLFLHYWTALFGDSEFAVRAPSIILGAATVIAVYAVGRLLAGTKVALLAALLVSLSTFHLNYSIEARMYGMLAFLATASFYFFLAYRRTASWYAWIGYVAVTTALVYTHAYAVFVLVAQNAFVVTDLIVSRADRVRWKSTLRSWVPAQLAVLVLFLPWLVVLLRQVETQVEGTDVSTLDPQVYTEPSARALLDTFRYYAGGSAGLALIGVLCLVALAIGAVNAPKREQNGEGTSRTGFFERPLLLVSLWLVIGVGLPAALSHLVTPLYHVRQTIAASVAFLLLAALVVARARSTLYYAVCTLPTRTVVRLLRVPLCTVQHPVLGHRCAYRGREGRRGGPPGIRLLPVPGGVRLLLDARAPLSRDRRHGDHSFGDSSVARCRPAAPAGLARQPARFRNRRRAQTRAEPIVWRAYAARGRFADRRPRAHPFHGVTSGGPVKPLALTAVVPATNRPETLARCVDAIRAANEPPEEIVVVEEPTGAGPSEARNRGARAAGGEIIVFVDSDVLVHADAFTRIRSRFAADSGLDAVFGAYDDRPEAPGVVSRFRNLLHHHVHVQSAGPITSFWAGLGAVRRDAFLELGGFDADRFPRAIEDIELGGRLAARGHRIELDPSIRGTHLKAWTLESMIRTDLMHRGVPWIALALEQRSFPATLNLGRAHRLSAVASVVLVGAVVARRPRAGLAGLGTLVLVNRSFYGLLVRRLGLVRLPLGIALHVAHHLVAVVAIPVGIGRFALERRKS